MSKCTHCRRITILWLYTHLHLKHTCITQKIHLATNMMLMHLSIPYIHLCVWAQDFFSCFFFETTYKTLDFNVFINYLLRLYKHFIARNMDNVNCFIGIAIICYNVVYWLKLKHSTWLGQWLKRNTISLYSKSIRKMKTKKKQNIRNKTGWHFNWMFWQKCAQEINHSCYSNIEFHKIDICEVADGKMTVNQHQPLRCEFV